MPTNGCVIVLMPALSKMNVLWRLPAVSATCRMLKIWTSSAQAAIFSPSDFSFPHDAILAEAAPNTEMTLIADVNLDLLKQVRTRGAARNHENRRPDLYRLEWF